MTGGPVLTIRNLRVVYPGDDGDFRAVRNVSFSLGRERLGIVARRFGQQSPNATHHHPLKQNWAETDERPSPPP